MNGMLGFSQVEQLKYKILVVIALQSQPNTLKSGDAKSSALFPRNSSLHLEPSYRSWLGQTLHSSHSQ
jgi:hypothetical protein